MSDFNDMEETIGAFVELVTSYGPDNPSVHQVAKAVEPIAVWHREYSRWQERGRKTMPKPKSASTRDRPPMMNPSAKELLRQFMAEKRK